MMTRALHIFEPFSIVHAGVVVLFALVWTVAIRWAIRHRGHPALSRSETTFAVLTLALWIVAEGYWALPSRFDPAYSFPIQFCDLTALVVPLVFFTGRRYLKGILYFWGFGLGLQAVITPELHAGPARLDFWLFWGYHSMIMGAGAYTLIVMGFRPTWRDYWYTVATTATYLAIILPINIAFGYNYGYVGNARPGAPTLVDVLGPWPQRVVVMSALVWIMFTLLALPWHWHRRRTRASK